jgi:micrococcal nuclease
LDCADVNGTNFTVLSPDPHGFDGDGDGVGCET